MGGEFGGELGVHDVAESSTSGWSESQGGGQPQEDILNRREREAVKQVAVQLIAKLESGRLLMGHLWGLAAKQAQLRGEVEN